MCIRLTGDATTYIQCSRNGLFVSFHLSDLLSVDKKGISE